MQNEEAFIQHWEILRFLIQRKWNRIKDKDLKGLTPTFDEIVNVILSKYQDEPKETIVQDLENLRQQILMNE